MRTLVLGLALSVAVDGARGQTDSTAKRDMAALQGTWSMVSGTSEGEEYAGVMLTGSRRIAQGNETTVTIMGQLFMKARFSVDPSKQPKAIDYDMIGGATAGKQQLGIYDVKGDTARFCFAEPGNPRPTEFTAKPGSKRMCSVWARTR